MAMKCLLAFAIILVALALVVQRFFLDVIEDNVDLFFNDLLMKGYVPDPLIRMGVRVSLSGGLRERAEAVSHFASVDGYVNDFVAKLKQNEATAEATEAANAQHYEVDASFYKPVLGFYNKYSSTLYLSERERKAKAYNEKPPSMPLADVIDSRSLDQSEVDMLDLYIARAELCEGNDCNLNVLDLGCGWGSFSLYYASKCPSCRITSISNSKSQIEFIQNRAKQMGLSNVFPRRVNVNELAQHSFESKFDRVISIEMFEHMKNYKTLLNNVKSVMECDGKLFVHMFVHKNTPYHFEKGWMAQYFFSGGTMPSHGMLEKFSEDFESTKKWKVNGRHYSYTLEGWLAKMDAKGREMRKIVGDIYGKDEATVTKWVNLWRTFFIACSELFNMFDGDEWFVGHYVLTPKC